MKLFVLNSKPSDPNGYIFQALVRALLRQEQLELVVLDPQDLTQVPSDPERQALLVYGGEELHRIPSRLLQAPFGRRAIWFTEDPYEQELNRTHAPLFQCVFSNDSGSVMGYSAARHLPLAADPRCLPPGAGGKPSRLAFFSGMAWPNRKALLTDLVQAWPEAAQLDLHLVANPVVEAQGGHGALGAGLRFQAPIPISEFCLRAADSLCTLVIGRDFSGSGHHRYARSPGPRLFEAGLTGSCQLVHAAEIPEMPADLEEGRHYLRFHNLASLIDLLREAQANPDRFQAIGATMAASIGRQHTYDQRAQQLVAALRQCQPEPLTLPATAATAPQRLLFVSHEQSKPGFHHGGAGLCLDQIVATAPAGSDVRVLCRSGDDGHRFELLDGNGAVVGGFRCQQRVDEFSLHHSELEGHLQRLLSAWQPQVVHVNHLIGFTAALLPLARRAGARTLITLHDYFVLCDSWNLLDADHRFCDISSFFDPRCHHCTALRRPGHAGVDPMHRRVVMAEALAHVHRVIVPSAAAESQLRRVFPHLPATTVIEPAPPPPAKPLAAASGPELVVLVAGNLAANKGYHDLKTILQHVEQLRLPVQLRVLGRVDSWIQKDLAQFSSVELLGRYTPAEFSTRASGCDLALFLSPWPETYCITFDEWRNSGRACLYYAIGALAEAHRQIGLHPASRGLAAGDVSGVVAELITACTPAGLQHLRQTIAPAATATAGASFAERHWLLYRQVLSEQPTSQPLPWHSKPDQRWLTQAPLPSAAPALQGRALWRARLRHLVYRLPGGHRAAALWRRLRGG